MDTGIYNDAVIDTLIRHLRSKRSKEERPIFLFTCGGVDPPHPARRLLKEHIDHAGKREGLRNVICVRAESVAADPLFEGIDLLTQEAMIADISDGLVLFAESVGSFCELGAFSALPHVLPILSVAVGREYKGHDSYLNNGPVAVVERADYPLSKVFYLNLDCPMEAIDFLSFIHHIRAEVSDSEERKINLNRKKLSDKPDRIQVGSLAHELLDLIYLVGPISGNDLINLYCTIKHFPKSKLKIVSQTQYMDIQRQWQSRITYEQVVAFMKASNIIGTIKPDKSDTSLYYSKVHLNSYFMFKNTESKDFLNMRSGVLLKKRNRGQLGARNVYKRF